jgi:Tol biopolymer transport system component
VTFVFSESDIPNMVAYTVLIDGYWQIKVFDVGKKHGKILTFDKKDKTGLSFMPDRKTIIFADNAGKLYSVDAMTGKIDELSVGIRSIGEPCCSKDVNKIYFTEFRDVQKDNSAIWEFDLKTKKLSKIIDNSYLQFNPAISPDGKSLYYIDGPEFFSHEVFKKDLSTGDFIQVTSNHFYDMEPDISCDGKKIAFSSKREDGFYNIYISDNTGMNEEKMTKDGSFNAKPKWSQNSKLIYFISDRAGELNIWFINVKTGEEKLVCKDVVNVTGMDLNF